MIRTEPKMLPSAGQHRRFAQDALTLLHGQLQSARAYKEREGELPPDVRQGDLILGYGLQALAHAVMADQEDE